MPSRTVRGACLSCCSLLVYMFFAAAPQTANSEELLSITVPAIASPSMPKVLFPHDKHVTFVESHEGDCSRCHRMTPDGLSQGILDVRLQKESTQVEYLHMACTSCHVASGQGPSIASCRTCHVQGNALRAMKK